MKSLRTYVYAAVLAAAALNFAPSLAAAQEPAHGRFTLTHDVHWVSATLPAGEYVFFFDPNSISHTLNVNKVSGSATGFMLLVTNTEDSKPTDTSRLVLEATPAGSYVKTMQLPEFGMTLTFSVPTRSTETKLARTATTGLASGQ